jgi:hypothetical protein
MYSCFLLTNMITAFKLWVSNTLIHICYPASSTVPKAAFAKRDEIKLEDKNLTLGSRCWSHVEGETNYRSLCC